MRYSAVITGSDVRFRLKDIICPDREQIVANLTNRLQLLGRVIFLSDSGDLKDHYAIVEVEGLISPVIVPVGRVALPKRVNEKEYI